MTADHPHEGSGLVARARRHGWAMLLVVLVVVALASAWIGTQLGSPRSVDALTAPSPSDLTAPVEWRTVVDTLITRGVVGADQMYEVAIPSLSVGGPAVVTGTPARQGDGVAAGDVLVEVSGRPLFALQGPVPAYRDLRPDDFGPDVKQLQHALIRAGAPGVRATGKYDDVTALAVASLYLGSGHSLPGLAIPPSGVTYEQRTQAYLPAAEVAFIPRLPARVLTIGAEVGEPPGDAMLRLATGDDVVIGTLPIEDSTLVRPGDPVLVDTELSALAFRGEVAEIRTSAAAEQQGLVEIVVRPAAPVPDGAMGTSVRLRIRVAGSRTEKLVVPSSAVWSSGDGTEWVTLLLPDGSHQDVTVVTGLEAGGSVEIEPQQGTIAPGDLVIVGLGPASGS